MTQSQTSSTTEGSQLAEHLEFLDRLEKETILCSSLGLALWCLLALLLYRAQWQAKKRRRKVGVT
jgi:hypothetical protein